MIKRLLWTFSLFFIILLFYACSNNNSLKTGNYISHDGLSYLTIYEDNEYIITDIDSNYIVTSGDYYIKNNNLVLKGNNNEEQIYFEIKDDKLICLDDKGNYIKEGEVFELSEKENFDAEYVFTKVPGKRKDEIQQLFDISEDGLIYRQKVKNSLDLDIPFKLDRIGICFKETKFYPKLEIEDFNFYNIKLLEYVFLAPKDINNEKFKQMAVIYLNEHGEEKVLEALEELNKLDFILFASPIFIYEIIRF